jgi:hypothetical protein
LESKNKVSNKGPQGVNLYMHLYSITNLINNKKYIGITSRENPIKRWNEHKCSAKNDRQHPSPITNAIKKYGFENFIFEVLKTFENISIEGLLSEETSAIIKYNTLAPNGYNLRLQSGYRHFSEKLSQNLSKGQQGNIRKRTKQKTSDFIGVYKTNNIYYCEIAHRRKKYKKSFLIENEAVSCYDKMAIYLYGQSAKTNFDKSFYSEQQIDECFSSFSEKNIDIYSSKYKGIHFSKERGVFRIKFNKKYIGQASTEIEAKKILDEYVENMNDPSFVKKREKHKKSTLEKIEKTKNLLKKGLSHNEIAKELSISKYNIKYIIQIIHGSHPICK